MKSTLAVQSALERIGDLDQGGYTLNSVLALADDALEQAFHFDQSALDLPLRGLPILIKDNIEARGLPATAGSLALVDTPVLQDSTIARRLREAGAIIIGSTNLSEWANIRSSKSTSGWSAVGGLTANPWKHGQSAGGSSSGSGAAVAAGLTQWAIGSETDGSIVCPASLNGCIGIKPTVGSIPRDGMIPISASQDSPGPMAQTVLQASLLLDVLTSNNKYVAAASAVNHMRVGVVRQWMTTNSDVNSLFEESLERLEKTGFKLADVELTPPEAVENDDELMVLLFELGEGIKRYLQYRPGARVATLKEIVTCNRLNSTDELQYFGQELFEQALEFETRKAEYLISRNRNLSWAQRTLDRGFEDVDILIGCTYGPAWESSLLNGDKHEAASWITQAPAIAGTPIGTIPMGLVSRLPVGLGLVAKRDHESTLINAMAQAERALGLGILQPTFLKGT